MRLFGYVHECVGCVCVDEGADADAYAYVGEGVYTDAYGYAFSINICHR